MDALVDKIYYCLNGHKFVIHTNHAAFILIKNAKNLGGRLFRLLLKLTHSLPLTRWRVSMALSPMPVTLWGDNRV